MKYTGKRKWSERDHPRDPRTGEFVEKTGAHAGWLMNIANRLPGAGPNLGGGTVGAGGTLRPGVGTRSASSLRKGDHARVNGVDSTGRKTSFTGYVQGVGPVTMRQGKQRTPMLAVQVAETPSGGGGARTTVYVPRDAKVERARPGGDVARLEGTRTGDDKLAQLMAGKAAPGLTSMSDEQLERAFRDQQGRMAGLSVTDPRFVEQDAIAKALRAERARRAGPLEQRVSDQIGKARGELDTPRVKRDDSGMSPASAPSAASATPETKPFSAKKGDLVVVTRTTRDYVIGKDSEERTEVIVGTVESASRDGKVKSFKAAGWNSVDRVRTGDKVMGLSAKQVDVAKVMEVAGKNTYPNSTTPKAFDSLEEVRALSKPFLLKEGEKPSTPATREIGPKAVRVGDRVRVGDEGGRFTVEVTVTGLAEDTTRGRNKAVKFMARNDEGKEGAVVLRPVDKVTLLDRPSAKPTAASPAAKPRNTVESAVNALKTLNDRDEARAALDGLTVAQLKQVAEGVNRRGITGRKADIIDQLVASTVGHRLTTDAILSTTNRSFMPANTLDAVINNLKTATSIEAANAMLDGLSPAQLRTIMERENIPSRGRGADQMRRDIVGMLTSGRLQTRGVMEDARTLGGILDDTKATFTPARDPDPNSKEGFALSLRQLPGAALRGTAAELEAGDITPDEAATRLSEFLRSPAARAMSQSDRRGFSVLEGRMRAAGRAALGLDRPAPRPEPGVYDSITKRSVLLAMLRTRELKAKRGAPDAELRRPLVEDDNRKGEGLRILAKGGFNEPFISGSDAPKPAAPRESVADAQTIESLAAMKRPALLALRRNTPGARNLRRGATEREIAEEIVRARNENKAAATRKFEALRDPENLAGTGADTFDRVAQRAAESRTSDTIGMLEADNMIAEVLANLSEPGARAITFRSLAGGHAANKPVAKKFRDLALQYQNEADAKLANDFADNLTVRTSKSLPGKKKNIPNLPDGYEVRDTGKKTFDDKPKLEVFGPDGTVIGTVEQYESRTPTKKQGNVALGWRTTKGWRFTPAGSRFPTRESTDRDSISAAINGHLAFAPKAEPAAPARVNFADSREIFNRHSQLTRAQFDAMPADARERILDELRSVRDSGEQQSYTNRGTRSNLGITSRGLTDASWVRGAREKIRELTYVAPPPVDNSIAGRAARLKSGDTGSFGALDGVTLDEFADLAKAAGFAAPGRSWKRPKAVKYLEDQVRMGDRRPKSSNPAQMAEAMRGATNREALAILDYVEAGQGLTKADMKAIAKELGVPLRNGDTYTMKNALAAAAKEAVGKA